MNIITIGASAFGVVIGWVAYRTIRRTQTNGLNDISAVIAAVGGGAITKLFPTGGEPFGAYSIGLAIGFFAYLIVSLIIAGKTEGLSKAYEWLGEPQNGPTTTNRGKVGSSSSIPPIPSRPSDQ